MKEVILGIKDYLKDCWHDWLIHRLSRFYFLGVSDWKEDSIWYYIRQRRIAKKVKALKESK